jgi:hypothetical protein
MSFLESRRTFLRLTAAFRIRMILYRMSSDEAH